MSLAAWIVVPAFLYATSIAVALLVERVARVRLPAALLVPVGLCTEVALVLPVYRVGLGGWAAVVLLALCVIAGVASGREGLGARVREDWFALAAGLVVYLVYLAPVILTGGWTWTGYNFVNDTAVQFLLADHLFHTGTTMPLGPPKAPAYSTASEHVRIYLVTAYPLGLHGLLATLRAALQIPIEAMYQPVIGALAGAGAIALAWLVRVMSPSRVFAAGVAVVAMCANLTYNYGLQGNAKEIGIIAALAIAAAVGRWTLTAERPVAAAGVAALPLAAAISFFSAAAVPYAGCFAIVLLAGCFVQRRSTLRHALVRSAIAGVVVAGLASLATLVKIVQFGKVAKGTFGATSPAADLGHLLRPLPLSEASGVWLRSDYRLPTMGSNHELTTIATVAVIVLLALGIAWCLRRREAGPLLLFATSALTLAIVGPKVSPYAEGKMLAILAPTAIAGAGIGCVLLARVWRPLGYAVALALGTAVMASNALSYHVTQLAPVDRMEAMHDIGKRYGHQGPMLVDELDEFAKYFMQPVRMNVALETITPDPAREKLSRYFMLRSADIDQMPVAYLERFPLIAQRIAPNASRPPFNYKLDYENRYYRVFRRAGPKQDVPFHLPLQDAFKGALRVPCDVMARMQSEAKPGSAFVASELPATVELDTVSAPHPPDWPLDGDWTRSLQPHSPGTVSGTLRFAEGSYDVWIAGTTGRPLDVRVDGRSIGHAVGVNTRGEWLRAARSVHIGAGDHHIEVVRPRGNLAPGDGYEGAIGPVVFEALPARITLLRAKKATAFCGKTLDWVETVRGAP